MLKLLQTSNSLCIKLLQSFIIQCIKLLQSYVLMNWVFTFWKLKLPTTSNLT